MELLYFKNKPKIRLCKIKPYSNGFTHISITVNNLETLYADLIKLEKYLPWIDDFAIYLENGNFGRLRNGELRHLFGSV